VPLQRRHGVASLNRARAHVDAGELAAAQELLSQMLATLPADARKARPAEAEAAVLQTGVLLSLGEAHAARGWAAYGHATFRRLYGDRDRRTLHSLGLLAAVLNRVGAHGRAAQRYEHLIQLYTELEGPHSERTLAARADLATVDHARGHCVQARRDLANIIADHQAAFGLVHPVSVRMLARLAGMYRDCGEQAQARSLLDQARANAVGLPAEIVDLLSVAVRVKPDTDHVCEVVAADVETPRTEIAVREAPIARPFSTFSYLPEHPRLVAWEVPRLVRVDKAPARRMSSSTMALVAAVIGIVAVAVLFVIVVSTMSSD
jgi:tetratricopeptide (TPR) repeat protein